jgi:hypothetical protein
LPQIRPCCRQWSSSKQPDRENAIKSAANTGFCAQKSRDLAAVAAAFLLALFVTLQRVFVPCSHPEFAQPLRIGRNHIGFERCVLFHSWPDSSTALPSG